MGQLEIERQRSIATTEPMITTSTTFGESFLNM